MKSVADRVQDDIYERDVVIIPNVANVTPISQNAQQMELMESRKFSVREIARMTGVPPILLMDDSNSSYKSPEAATQEFLLRTIQPAIREWENELDSKLLTPQEYGRRRFHVCEQSLLRLDPKGQADLYKTLLEIGVTSPDELRYKYDLPSILNGDKHYISTNLAEVGSEKLRGHEQEGGEA
jgi:HK97 family phage portal protein